MDNIINKILLAFDKMNFNEMELSELLEIIAILERIQEMQNN